MRFAAIQRVMGLLLAMFSTALLPPIGLSLHFHDGAAPAFAIAYGITLGIGLLLWLPVLRNRDDIRVREGFLIVTLFWTLLALFGALPFLFSERPTMSVTDAFFESMSGLSTTGATVLSGIDSLPESIRYYRQQLQWLGGMGIVVLAVAVMPMLGVGGMQLYRAETPGPAKETKLTPRIAETAKALWYIYLGLTVACILAFWWAGMSLFDAVGHSFATIATGGFSTHDQSLGYFQSTTINLVAVVFMVLAGMNFALHFHAWHARSPLPYLGDPEVRTYLGVLFVVSTLSIVVLNELEVYPHVMLAVDHGLFQAVSIATNTGFTTTGFHVWPVFLPALLLTASFIGGCAGSTAGGIKVIRVLLLYKQGLRELRRLVHPDAVLSIKVGDKPIEDRIMNAIWGFFSLYVVTFVVLTLAMTATGTDLITAFSAVTACLNNLGPGLGEVSATFAGLTPVGKWILCAAMLLGRLELFTFLALLTPAFWRG